MNTKQALIFSLIYFFLISLYGICICILDKKKAKNHSRRISEKHIFTAAILGGALAEYITMKKIRHKTLHKRFMIGLPLIFIVQIAVSVTCFYFFYIN